MSPWQLYFHLVVPYSVPPSNTHPPYTPWRLLGTMRCPWRHYSSGEPTSCSCQTLPDNVCLLHILTFHRSVNILNSYWKYSLYLRTFLILRRSLLLLHVYSTLLYANMYILTSNNIDSIANVMLIWQLHALSHCECIIARSVVVEELSHAPCNTIYISLK